MSIPLPGTYRIRNVQYPNQMFDLSGGGVGAGTPVIGHINNTGSQNMLWTLQVVEASTRTVRMINVASGTFAQPASSGSGVVGSPSASLFRIIPRENEGEFSIKTTNEQLACGLANANNYTQVTLHSANLKDASQGWIFCPA